MCAPLTAMQLAAERVPPDLRTDALCFILRAPEYSTFLHASLAYFHLFLKRFDLFATRVLIVNASFYSRKTDIESHSGLLPHLVAANKDLIAMDAIVLEVVV